MFKFITNRSLAFKMSFFLLISTILIFVIILFFNYKISQNIIVRNLKDYTLVIKKATVNSIDEVFRKNQNFAYSFKELLEGTSLTKNELYRFMYDAVQSNDYVYGCSVMFEPYSFVEDTMYYAPYFYNLDSANTKFGRELFQSEYLSKEYYKKVKLSRKPFWAQPYIDTLNGIETLLTSYRVPFYYPIKDTSRFRGVISVDISLDWLKNYMSKIKPFKTGYLILISENGTIISRTDTNQSDEYFQKNDNIFDLKDYRGMDYLKSIKSVIFNNDTNLQVKNSKTNEIGRLFLWHLNSSDWVMIMYVPDQELLKDFYTLFRYLIGISIIGFILLIFVTIVISRRFTKPIKNLAKITHEIGKGNFNITLPEIKTKDEVGILNSAINKMQNSLKLYVKDIEKTTSARERIEQELQIARDIQMGIIPKNFPPFPKIKSFDLFAHLEQAREVGGDLYDFFMIDHDHLCIAIGDVSGKGVPAALFMAISRTLLRAKATLHFKPQEIIASMNRTISNENENQMFVTFAIGILDIFNGDFEYCSAGHNPPYIYRANGDFELMKIKVNIPLGIDSEYTYKSDKLTLGDGDKFFIYTDGVTEAMDNKGDFFTDERLLQSLSLHKDENITEIIHKTKKDIFSFTKGSPQSDDLAMMILSYFQTEYNNCITESIVIPNNLAYLNNLTDFIRLIGNQYLFSQKILFELNLVLEELVTNTINYGYIDSLDHEIEIVLYLCKDEIIIEIKDDSEEFDPFSRDDTDQIDKPAEEREIGGLGIFFVKTYADSYSYKRENGKNIISLIKKIESPVLR
jgi:sigma-B regulation protein RsbU (phosphoserine phosphatase)